MLTLRLERDLVDQLYAIKVRDGVPVNEQIRRAVQAWLEEKRTTPASKKPRRG